DDLMAVDLTTQRERLVHRSEARFGAVRGSMISVTSDGRYVCTSFHEDLSSRFHTDLAHGYVGFAQYWEAKPTSRVVIVPVDGGPAREVLGVRCWLGHVNASPTRPNLLTYCHE